MACNLAHRQEECCCGHGAQELPSCIFGKLLRVCAQGACQCAIEAANGGEWAYSFEAERESCCKQAKHASSACKGIVSEVVRSLATCLPHVSKEPNNALDYIKELGAHADSRPVFHRLFLEAGNKLACITQLAPQVYHGTGVGIRSGFCTHESSLGQCFPCEALERHIKLYKQRAVDKTTSFMAATQAARSDDAQTLTAIYPPKASLLNLTGVEWRQRAAVHGTQLRADKQKAARAAVSTVQLKEQVKVFEEKLEHGADELPELVKLFTMVTDTGTPSKTALPCLPLNVSQHEVAQALMMHT